MDILRAYLRREGRNLAWLASQVGRSRNSVKKWKRVPAGLVLRTEAATGIGRSLLRPDLYPPDPAPPATEPRVDAAPTQAEE